MNRSDTLSRRHVIPRWNSIEKHLLSPEAVSAKVGVRTPDSSADNSLLNYEIALQLWKQERNLYNSLELLSQARLNNLPDEVEAVEFIRRAVLDNHAVPDIVNRFITEDIEEPMQAAPLNVVISDSRKRAYLAPRDAFNWVELARNYLIRGNKDKCKKCLLIAKQLAPSNRFVLRALARFYQHYKEYGLALDTLRSSVLIVSDPWIIASELAITSSIQAHLYKFNKAREMIFNESYNPFSITELASEVATIEAQNSNTKAGKRAFAQSLKKPNENSFAQAIWAAKNLVDLGMNSICINPMEDSFEGDVYCEIFNGQNWDSIAENILAWHKYQPFSIAPVSLGTVIFDDVLGKHQDAINLCEAGLISNSGDYTTNNNLAYSLILAKKKEEARKLIEGPLSRRENLMHDILYYAIKGMFEMRFGDIETGKSFYQTAAALATNSDYRLSVDIYYLREKKLTGEQVKEEARLLVRKVENSQNYIERVVFDSFHLLD